MRITIEINEQLFREAMRHSQKRTQRAVVEEGLRLLVETRGQVKIRRLRGKARWEDDLDSSRLGRNTD